MQSVLMQIFVPIEPNQEQRHIDSVTVTVVEEGGVVAINIGHLK